jgi:hypothetical protein
MDMQVIQRYSDLILIWILFEIDKLLFTVFLKYKVNNNNRNQYDIIMTIDNDCDYMNHSIDYIFPSKFALSSIRGFLLALPFSVLVVE